MLSDSYFTFRATDLSNPIISEKGRIKPNLNLTRTRVSMMICVVFTESEIIQLQNPEDETLFSE